MRLSIDLPLTAEGVSGRFDDGRPFVIRPIRATDGPALEAAFASMSARSRYLRFFTVRDRLGADMVERLTDVDHDTHRAWVVSDPTLPSDVGTDEGKGVAVARLVRLADDDGAVAEAAVAVIDSHQGRGYGRLLLDLLVGTAHDVGIERLRFEVLAENDAMRAVLGRVGADLRRELSDSRVLVYDVPVGTPDTATDPPVGALYDVLRWIAASDPPARQPPSVKGSDP